MKIRFHEALYDLVNSPNIQPTRFQATIEKGESTYDSIIADTVNADEITIYNDDEEIQGVYTGYTKRIAITIIDYISVELENTDVVNAINTLAQQINEVQEVQNEHSNDIAELNEELADLTPYTDTKTGYYGETEKTFYDVPDGNVSVFFNNYNGEYSINRIENRLTVSFNALEKETNITISIQ